MVNLRTYAIAMLISVSLATGSFADATLSILHSGASGPFVPGELVHLNVRVTDIPLASPAAGFQAFIKYDTELLEFVRGAYTSTPFPLHIIVPIVAVNGEIDLAAGINIFTGDRPTTDDSDLASLTFEVLTNCGVGSIEFRSHEPPTNLSTMTGQPILPLQLVDLVPIVTCPPDVTGDNAIGVADLLFVIAAWGACAPAPDCCPGDVDSSGAVGVADLLAIISAWGVCP